MHAVTIKLSDLREVVITNVGLVQKSKQDPCTVTIRAITSENHITGEPIDIQFSSSIEYIEGKILKR